MMKQGNVHARRLAHPRDDERVAKRRRWHRAGGALGALLGAVISASVFGACHTKGDRDPATEEPEAIGQAQSALATTVETPIGLALDFKDGDGVPLKVRAGQKFFLEQIDLSTSIFTSVDEGVNGLRHAADFASVSWQGLTYEEQEFLLLPDANGKFTRARFYRDAAWMRLPSVFVVNQIDASGLPTSAPIVAFAGRDDEQKPVDHFFVRRFRAIQWTRGCPTITDCTGATNFEEEALIELRNALDQQSTFVVQPDTVAFEMRWSLNATHRYVVPVQQVASPPYDYGFSIDVAAVTPPGPNGYYLPGDDITFQITLRDGAGNRLHPQGSLPSYNDVVFGPNEAGIQYFRGFFDQAWVFWRRKHRERTLIAHLMGPLQDVKPIQSIIPLDEIITQDVQNVGIPSRDGVFDQWKVFPATDAVFGGALDPTHAAWATPGSDTWSYHLPDDAQPGTYRLAVKGRRTYYGEDIAFTRTLEIQVGSPTPTSATLTTGNCNTCHTEGGSLAAVLHRNPNRATCVGCHAPLGVEYDAPIHTRAHFIHSRSNRYDAPVTDCSTCHLNTAGIQRTSKAACLSCHTSYPADHVAAYGPIVSIYVGGSAESFNQCSTTCHTTHPNSGL